MHRFERENSEHIEEIATGEMISSRDILNALPLGMISPRRLLLPSHYRSNLNLDAQIGLRLGKERLGFSFTRIGAVNLFLTAIPNQRRVHTVCVVHSARQQ